MTTSRSLLSLAFVAVLAGPLSAQTTPSPRDGVMWSAILSAEDSRPTVAQALGPLAGGTRYPDAEIRRLAVRGLGRLERDTIRSQKALLSIADLISQELSDSSASVRVEAANALAQSVQHVNPDAARDTLLAHLKTERDPAVRGEIAQALARLPYQSPVAAIEAALVEVAADTALPAVLGAARGYDALYRALGKNSAPSAESVARLNQLARYNPRGRAQGTRPDSVARVRRLAVTALLNGRRIDAATLAAAAADPDPQVRRMAVVALGVLDSIPDRSKGITAALRDASPMVRYDAVRVYGQRQQATAGCGPIIQALADKSPHVMLLAIDLLGVPCEAAGKQQAVDRLAAYTEQLAPAYGLTPASTQTWHQPAHAVVSLAKVAPDRASAVLPKFARHTTWWVRMYAARAAAELKDVATLTRLGYDENDNVREAAVTGLSAVSGHAADSVYIAALARKDYQLQVTAAKALEKTPNPDRALAALNAALQRVTGENRETSRDARMAMLQRIGDLGGPSQVSQIQLYLYDWDPAIANETAKIVTRWSGTPQEATPTSLEYPRLPGLARIAELSKSKAVFHMRGGGIFEIALRPLDAPTNVERFARLAAAGSFDGLTFHRVVPNFVIQGGSPGANEYWGDGPFTRDELTTEEHVRGTVGISTRGRDTGDGQIFVNLVDNPRLDHQYTIIGEITSGMDVVDGLLEGATMEKVEIVPLAR